MSDASHELRTPLTSIRGFAELYRRGGARTPADVELLTGRIEAEATRMGVLVEDLLLLLARLDQQRTLDITDVDLLVLAADAVHDAKARDPDRPVTLIPGTDSVHVLGDEHKLRQVVTNLVTNALIHTPAGTAVQLAVRQHVPSPRDEPPVAQAGTQKLGYAPVGVLEVRDEGPGIPPGQASQVFDRFHSFDPGRTHNRGGSGLGLAITAAILEAHNGRIELHTASPHRHDLPRPAAVGLTARGDFGRIELRRGAKRESDTVVTPCGVAVRRQSRGERYDDPIRSEAPQEPTCQPGPSRVSTVGSGARTGAGGRHRRHCGRRGQHRRRGG